MENWRTTHHLGWRVIEVRGRVDAFHYDQFVRFLETEARSCVLLALDLSQTQFLSIPAIKYVHQVAESMLKSGGQLVLIAPGEKIKRQVDIFASLDPMKIFRKISELPNQLSGETLEASHC